MLEKITKNQNRRSIRVTLTVCLWSLLNNVQTNARNVTKHGDERNKKEKSEIGVNET